MAPSAIRGLADSVLSGLVQSTTQAAASREAFASLFLPPQLQSPFGALPAADLVAFLSTARSSLLDLSTAATHLDLGSPLSDFYGGTVTSSNASAVKGQITAGVSASSRPEATSYTFSVSQVARAQANVGTALSSSATSSFQAGTNTVRFVQNGVTTDVNFTVAANDTNLTVLTNLSSAVNAASGLSVAASVNTDAVGGTSQLVLTSENTGTTYAFTVANQAGTPVTNAGVGSATTGAQNASYTLNGTSLGSNSNEFYVGAYANLRVTLLTTTSSDVVLAVKRDTDKLTADISGLVNAYNTTKAVFDTIARVNPAAASNLALAVNGLHASLDSIGIGTSASGTLTIDSTRLASALTDKFDTVQRVVGDARGLAPELRSVADTLLAQPSNVIAPPPVFDPGYAPATLTGMYSRRLNGMRLTGLLVDLLL